MSERFHNKTVLHLTDYGAPYAGNFIASLRALERHLGANGIRMLYVLPKRAGDMPWVQQMRREQANVFVVEQNGFFAYARQIRSLLREYDVSILHAHFIHFREKIAALFAAKTCGHRVKTVLHLHNHLSIPKSPISALPQRLYLPHVSRFVCCSGSVAQHLVADGVAPSRVAVAENAIEFERLDTYESLSKEAFGIPAGDRIALMFGFNYLRKGVDLAVEAVRSLRDSGESVTLCIVLSSQKEEVEAAILRQLAAKELPDWVKLLPARSDVADYYHLADVFLSPSREEGFCYALVEAVYCQTPVLASEIDAQRDLALPKSAFFRSQDASALCTALSRVLNEQKSASTTLALQQASQCVKQTYSLSRWAERVLEAYREIS